MKKWRPARLALPARDSSTVAGWTERAVFVLRSFEQTEFTMAIARGGKTLSLVRLFTHQRVGEQAQKLDLWSTAPRTKPNF